MLLLGDGDTSLMLVTPVSNTLASKWEVFFFTDWGVFVGGKQKEKIDEIKTIANNY